MKLTVSCKPFQPILRSIDERNESALESVMETLDTASVVASGEDLSSNKLCFKMRLKYCWPLTITLCVLHRCISPDVSVQSNKNSGVPGTSSSFRSLMVAMLHELSFDVLSHASHGAMPGIQIHISLLTSF